MMPSFSNELFLFFRSDSSRSARGFELYWDGTAQGENYCICLLDAIKNFPI